MAEINRRDRKALEVLSETVTAELGPASIVAREVDRAYRSGRDSDLRTASAAFDALPGWQRSRIGVDATKRARRLRGQTALSSGRMVGKQTPDVRDTARDWRDIGDDGRISIPSPPRFLRSKK